MNYPSYKNNCLELKPLRAATIANESTKEIISDIFRWLTGVISNAQYFHKELILKWNEQKIIFYEESAWNSYK
jgi:hypothetical protein